MQPNYVSYLYPAALSSRLVTTSAIAKIASLRLRSMWSIRAMTVKLVDRPTEIKWMISLRLAK